MEEVFVDPLLSLCSLQDFKLISSSFDVLFFLCCFLKRLKFHKEMHETECNQRCIVLNIIHSSVVISIIHPKG